MEKSHLQGKISTNVAYHLDQDFRLFSFIDNHLKVALLAVWL